MPPVTFRAFCRRFLPSWRFIGLFCLLAAKPAWAQTAPLQQDSTFSPQRFHPAVGPDEFFGVEPAQPLPHLNFSVGLWLNYTRNEYSLLSEGPSNNITGTRAHVIKDALGGDLVLSLGLWNRLQLGLLIPATLYQAGDPNYTFTYQGATETLQTPQSAFALGDPQIDVKVRLWGHERGLNLSLAAFVNVPLSLATPHSFGGDKGVSVGGKVLLGWEGERWRAGVTFGGLWRQDQSTFFSSTIGSQLSYGAAFGYDVIAHRKLTVLAEIFGSTDLSGASNIDSNPAEVDVGLKVRFIRSLTGSIGVGTGITAGIGAPAVRVLAGLTYAPDRRDRDHDGVPDIDDKCPDVPEDRDGFQDDDGCPELDNDGDGIPDAEDKCPNDPEDFDGFQDQDGCPEPDNDNDGIPDIKDACPMFPEDHKMPKPNDGCPLDKTDSDEDGIPDNIDKCPLEPEDKDGFQDEDGCPDPDNDNDGVPDTVDKCPNVPEDKDGFQDEDGCPDPDNDNDGIPDALDKCPNEPETVNGYMDEDGCPDKGPPLKVQIVGDEIVILEKVFFKTAKAVIEPKSFNLLDQITSILRLHPELKKVEIDGHTDGKGKRAKNLKLSQERADAVRFYLIRHGIVADRLVAKGFGPDKPVAENKTERGREANRRVEFHILAKDAPPPAAPVTPAAPDTAPDTQ